MKRYLMYNSWNLSEFSKEKSGANGKDYLLLMDKFNLKKGRLFIVLFPALAYVDVFKQHFSLLL